MKNEKQKEIKKEEKKVEEPKTPKTTVHYIKQELVSGKHKTRDDVAKTAFDKMKQAGLKTNTRGKELKAEKVLSLCNAMLRDINQERKGWWSTFKIVEDEKVIKIVPKN